MIRDPLASRELLGRRGIKDPQVSQGRPDHKERPDRLVRRESKDPLA